MITNKKIFGYFVISCLVFVGYAACTSCDHPYITTKSQFAPDALIRSAFMDTEHSEGTSDDSVKWIKAFRKNYAFELQKYNKTVIGSREDKLFAENSIDEEHLFDSDPNTASSLRNLIEKSLKSRMHISITYGTPDSENNFSTCVALGSASTSNAFGASGCLITPTEILTAAHVWHDGNAKFAFIGGTYVGDPAGKYVQVSDKVDILPSYVYSTNRSHEDLCILHLLEPITSITPCVLSSSLAFDDATSLCLVGFGDTNYSGTEGYGIRRYTLGVFHSKYGTDPDGIKYHCKPNFEFIDGGNPSNDGHRKSSCEGDSGGPVFIPNPSGGWYLTGCTSGVLPDPPSNFKCGDGAIHTRVDAYKEFIDNHAPGVRWSQ